MQKDLSHYNGGKQFPPKDFLTYDDGHIDRNMHCDIKTFKKEV
jgi:hypothetical protein